MSDICYKEKHIHTKMMLSYRMVRTGERSDEEPSSQYHPAAEKHHTMEEVQTWLLAGSPPAPSWPGSPAAIAAQRHSLSQRHCEWPPYHQTWRSPVIRCVCAQIHCVLNTLESTSKYTPHITCVTCIHVAHHNACYSSQDCVNSLDLGLVRLGAK